MNNLVISFSGGRTSGMMAHHIQTSPKYSEYNKLFIFANTGKEREETLLFVDKCDKNFGLNLVWVESVVTMQKGIGIEAITTNYAKASRQGEPFEAVIAKENMRKLTGGVPTFIAPYCSERLKKTPINKYAKQYFLNEKYITAIGFRYEDYLNNRVSKTELKQENFEGKIFPLLQDFDRFLSQKDILDFWKSMSFNLDLKTHQSNCDLCYKKSNTSKIKILRENPEIANWWIAQEQKWGGEFHYNKQTTKDLLEKSKLPYNIDLFDFQSDCICSI